MTWFLVIVGAWMVIAGCTRTVVPKYWTVDYESYGYLILIGVCMILIGSLQHVMIK